jgi:cytochrome c-type biogenesis protein
VTGAALVTASGFTDTAASGPLYAAIAVAALAGLLSFFAPCTLPLVPGYLSYVTGLAGTELSTTGASTAAVPAAGARRPAGRAAAGSVLFVAGFTAIFALMAYAAGALGRTLLIHERGIDITAGILIIILGLAFLDVLPWLGPTFRISRLPRVGVAGAPLLGAVFALSWTPCLSPTLAVVLGMAATGGSAGRGVILAAAYSLGMGLPFIGFGLGFPRLLRLAGFMRRNGRWVTRVGGLLLIAVGVALVSGVWGEFLNWLRATVGPGTIGI